jgi:hypothetical protein
MDGTFFSIITILKPTVTLARNENGHRSNQFDSGLVVDFAWFLSGMILGMFFHVENWLGCYASLKRRMYRLGHISFFGLGVVNLLFSLTVKNYMLAGAFIHCASIAFVIGAVAMPFCCLVMAHFPKAHLIFSIPVMSLIVGGGLTILELTKL